MNPLSANPEANPLLIEVARSVIRKTGDFEVKDLTSLAEAVMTHSSKSGDWHNLLVSVKDMECVPEFIQKASTGSYSSYEDLIVTFKSPCERMVAIHLSNALIAGNIDITKLHKIHLESFQGTRFLISGEAKMSLAPFRDAYLPKDFTFVTAFTACASCLRIAPHPCIDKLIFDLVGEIVEGVDPKVICGYKEPVEEVPAQLSGGIAGQTPMASNGVA